jgi:CRISPR-associated protein Csx3
MAQPIFTIHDQAPYRIVKFDIPGGVTTPDQFATVVTDITPQLSGAFVVLINGRGPVWGYNMIAHAAHPSRAIGTYDPRLGYVITETHDAQFILGQIIADPESNS